MPTAAGPAKPASLVRLSQLEPSAPAARLVALSRLAAVVAAAAGLGACGGGGSDAAAAVNPPASTWAQGVFLPSASFAAECAVPREGTDPGTGLPFPDVQGSVLIQNEWLRSWSNELYLWYDEIVDRDPSLHTTEDYFDLLKTEALTPSGTPKDQFHFTVPTDEWQALSQAGVAGGYGVEWAFISLAPPREAVVLYTEPGSPAALPPASLERGDRLVAIDGVDFGTDNTQAGIDLLNAAIFEAAPGDVYTFEIHDFADQAERSFSMQATNVTATPVQNVTTVDTTTGKVGYLLFNDHIATAEQALVDAVALLDAEDITDLVLDVRYNGGGFLVIASQLAYMIAGPTAAAGRTFEELRFNDKHPTTNPVTGEPLQPTPFVSTTVGLSATPGEALPTLDLPRVFVLTGPNTCSASESIVNGLLGIGVEVVQVGSTTCGKPYGFYPADNCGTTYFSIQFQGVNEAGFGDYTDGFSPANTAGQAGTLVAGCSVADDYGHALGDPAEARLAAALGYRETGDCPAATGLAAPSRGFSKSTAPPAQAEGRMIRSPLRENRIVDY